MNNLEFVKNRLHETNASLVVLYNNGSCKEYYNRRVEDIVSILKENKNALVGATIADKVIGKVVGSILTLAGVKEIYTDTISKFAIPVLDAHNIKYEYNNLADFIQNNAKTGMCPMENKFKDENNLKSIYNYFIETI